MDLHSLSRDIPAWSQTLESDLGSSFVWTESRRSQNVPTLSRRHPSVVLLLQDNLAEVFQSQQIRKSNLRIMRQSITVFLNSALQDRKFEKPNRHKRFLLVPIVGTALGSELSKVFLRPFTAPRADKFSCFVDKSVLFGSIFKEYEQKKL